MSLTEAETQALGLQLLSQIIEAKKTWKLNLEFEIPAGEQGADRKGLWRTLGVGGAG